ncbi:paladin-like [Tubulanus polymorphus]|uniref:paladin-like n=1 Tax=Tubulanus polymorphus TaxID=672921 RepID=UPI003DA23F4E
MVRTNHVAPIIIKNCKEEFQHVVDFKDPIVYGRVADNMPEHPMVRNKYFMALDVGHKVDQLGTLKQYKAPNVRYAKGDLPVYGLGQPTLEGLELLIGNLKDDGYQDIFVINLRAEPVLFLRDGYDLVPCTPRCQNSLNELPIDTSMSAEEVDAFEVKIRKEIIDLSTLDADNKFWFYEDIEMSDIKPPRQSLVKYEDDLSVSEEIFCRPTFTEPGLRYVRMCLPLNGAPKERDIDAFINIFKDTPYFFEQKYKDFPVLMFICQTGVGRSNIGMVLGSLVYSNLHGFPVETQRSRHPISDKTANYERGEFRIIQQLTQMIVDGQIRKQEVDSAIDMCSQLYNLRTELYKSKQLLESIQEDYVVEGVGAKDFYRKKATDLLECYFYLICFNAYLNEQYSKLFNLTFEKWMKSHINLTRLLSQLDISERKADPTILSRAHRYLVMDDYICLDVLSSQMDVKVSNFRRIQALPVYGMAQPCRQGLSTVYSHLTTKKQGHPYVVFFNLRDDVTLECNGITYSYRDPSKLDLPITLPGISATEIESIEDIYKKEVKKKKSFEVYKELNAPRELVEFQKVSTCLDLFEQQREESPELLYYRIPICDDRAIEEKDIDQLVSILSNIESIDCDEFGPALVFFCRTGKGRTTTAMAIAGLIVCHRKGFPYGTKPGEEERVSLPNAAFTKGDFQIVQRLVRRIPNGQQVKREVDFILDQCSETMTPMHYHIREEIFVTYNWLKKAKSDEERQFTKRRSLDYLERYLYLILFNAYLHSERASMWERPFSVWLKEIGGRVGFYDILDDLAFYDFESKPCELRHIRNRWRLPASKIPFTGVFH